MKRRAAFAPGEEMEENRLKEDCLICHAPLVYLQAGELMECAVCGKKEMSRTRCEKGHYVCNDCHMAGLDQIISLCLASGLKDPAAILEQMMSLPFCHMHGPEHHVMVGAALLTACKNAGGAVDLEKGLARMMERGKSIPGGVCGSFGACGAGLSCGIFVSILTGSTPLSEEPFALAHQMTAKALGRIGEIGGPRCCKRDSYLSIQAAVDFTAEHFGVFMESGPILCHRSDRNRQCIGNRCPFHPHRGLGQKEG